MPAISRSQSSFPEAAAARSVRFCWKGRRESFPGLFVSEKTCSLRLTVCNSAGTVRGSPSGILSAASDTTLPDPRVPDQACATQMSNRLSESSRTVEPKTRSMGGSRGRGITLQLVVRVHTLSC
jgi:hypothetical protein